MFQRNTVLNDFEEHSFECSRRTQFHPENNPTSPEYVGMPVQYLGNRRGKYDRMIKACEDHYGGLTMFSVCKMTKEDHVEMSLKQPSRMRNYTELSFKKIRAPKEVWECVEKFWEENKRTLAFVAWGIIKSGIWMILTTKL